MVLDLLGWLAEDESNKKSGRVKNAVRRTLGSPTKSYKGNKWGRKSLSTQKVNKVIELIKIEPKLTIRLIAEQSGMSIGSVHKLLSKIESKKDIKLNVQELTN
jgi:DNA invertase Pin-like site-specific DNA recombinase